MLCQASIFEGLSEEQVEAIVDLCEEVTCQQGQMLFWEGDEAEWLYILLEGEISVYVNLTSRPQRMTVSVISEPQQMVGWSALVAPHYFTASALCEKECRLIAIDGKALMQTLEQDPATGFVVARRINEVISSRMRNTRLALLKTL
jgi:CRP-like cAMP-binding protein